MVVVVVVNPSAMAGRELDAQIFQRQFAQNEPRQNSSG
jgi:hypothetical protein